MNCLGISCYFHDAAAALVVDGTIVAAAEEERFTRLKHDDSFPRNAIKCCLSEAGLAVSDLDLVCFYEKPLRKLERTLEMGWRWRGRSTSSLRHQLRRLVHEELTLEGALEKIIGYHGPVLYCEHHLSHAASAFFSSGFDEAAILTVDGVGEWATLSKYRGSGITLEKLAEIHYPNSLGLFYSTITAFLGFRPNTDEYKVMGLAAYGRPRYVDQMRRLIKVYEDRSFALNMDYFAFPYDDDCMYTQALTEVLGIPRAGGSPIKQEHTDIAASLQEFLNEIVVGIANDLHRETACSRLCLAGGVALNGITNWRIIQCTPFEEIFVQPAAGDSGAALGAALFAYHSSAKQRKLHRHTTLLGPAFSDPEIRRTLVSAGARFEELDQAEVVERAAELIHANQIVGWFQGRMEFGPRALGCRSILANPCNPHMKDILNKRVKFREDFQPFAPAVLVEHVGEYFAIDFPTPYMLLIPGVLPQACGIIPSVVHVDRTARVQTVDAADNPLFYRLIQAFAKRSGVPVLLNTSFNVQGEPIVCTPADAYSCFRGSDIDALFMGPYLVRKEV